MAPYQCPKQVLIWSLPTLAVLISLFWYRRRKPSLKSDPGGKQASQPSQSLGDDNKNRTPIEETIASSKPLNAPAATASPPLVVDSEKVEKLFSAIEKARRDLETSQPIVEVNSPEEDEANASQPQIKASTSRTEEQNIHNKQIDREKSNHPLVVPDKVLNQKPEVNDTLLNQKISENTCVEQINKDNKPKDFKNNQIASNKSDTSVSVCENLNKEVLSEEKVEENAVKNCVEETTCQRIVSVDCLRAENTNKAEQRKPIKEVVVEKVCTTSVQAQTTQSLNVIDLDDSSSSDECSIVEVSRSNTEVIDLTSSTESLAESVVLDNQQPKVSEASVTVKTENKKSDPVGGDSKQQTMALEAKQLQQHESVDVDSKLSSLELDSSHGTQEDGERDSANHSPAEIMLESPTLSHFSDAHSEGSSDSGKGCSDVATPPASGSSVAGDGDVVAGVYEFIIPQHLVGRLIGRHGAFLQEIRSTTHTNVFIKRHPDTAKLKICAIEGAQADIDSALSMIRQKFPLRRYPSLKLEKVTFVQVTPTCELAPEQFRLQLVEGVNNDVILSSLVSAGHMFLQQPTHPSYQQLAGLSQAMSATYCYPDTPFLEVPVKDGVCAAPAMGGWHRAQIVNVNDDEKVVDLRFLDYGGYMSCEYTILKKMRYDFLLLPFQAVECYLANVTPVGGSGAVWSEEAKLLVHNLIFGQVLQAQIYDYTEDGIPLIYLYATCGNQVVLVNQELVARGFADAVTQAPEQEVEE